MSCGDRSEGAQSVRHIKLSATFFSQRDQSGERISVDLSQNAGESVDLVIALDIMI